MVRAASYLLSIALHAGVIALALFWPMSQAHVDLNVPVYQVDLVTLAGAPGKPGDAGDPGPGETPQPENQPKAEAKPEPAPPQEPAIPPKAESRPPEPAPAPKPPKPVKPEVKPTPEPQRPEPAPKKGKDISAQKRAPEKPEPKKPPEAKKPDKPEPKKQVAKKEPEPAKKTEPKQSAEQKPKPEKPEAKPKEQKQAAAPKVEKPKTPTREQILAQALHAAQKDAAKREKQDRDILARELAQLRDSVTGSGAGQGTADDGQQGQGGQGGLGNQSAAYLRAVAQIIKDRWSFPNLETNRVLTAQVEIRLDRNGEILDYFMVTPSGRGDFDASALKAVAEAQQFNLLPAPPRKLNTIRINFNSQELR